MPEYRDVTALRHLIRRVHGVVGEAPISPLVEVLDACPQAPDHTNLLRALMRLVDEHNLTGPGVAVLRRRVDAALNETENQS